MTQISTVLNDLEEDVIVRTVNNVPLAEVLFKDAIISSKVYIQQRDYFVETTEDKLTRAPTENDIINNSSKWDRSPLKQLESMIDVAIFFQQKSHIVSNLCYGLLGGISLMQLVLTHTLVKGSKHEIISFLELYSKFGYIPSASFSILTTICFVFALDRIDLVTIKKVWKQDQHSRFSNWILLFLYSASFFFSMLCFKFDEIIGAYPETETSISNDLKFWRLCNFWRCLFGLIGWFVVCIIQPDDLLELHLQSLRENGKFIACSNQNSNR